MLVRVSINRVDIRLMLMCGTKIRTITILFFFFFFNHPAPPEISPLPLPHALPISRRELPRAARRVALLPLLLRGAAAGPPPPRRTTRLPRRRHEACACRAFGRPAERRPRRGPLP